MIYIREAHALDSFLPKGGGDDPILEDPRTLAERRRAASSCREALDLGDIPLLVDTLDDRTSQLYDAWPDRLFLVDGRGALAYQGGPGPNGFDLDKLEAAIDRLLTDSP